MFSYQGRDAWKIIYNSSVDGYLSLTTDWDYYKLSQYGEQPYQCVGFTKAGTNLDDGNSGRPSFWTQGQKLTTSYRPSSGTVIATFESDGDYNGRNNHTAIYVSGNSSYIYVLDQSGVAGYITVRAIPFSGSGNANASNYYVVEH